MRTKQKPARTIHLNTRYQKIEGPNNYYWVRVSGTDAFVGRDVITYDDPPPLYKGVYPWKHCRHDTDNNGHLIVGSVRSVYETYKGPQAGRTVTEIDKITHNVQPGRLPTARWDRTCLNGIASQLDLNSGENVLLYSGVIQAVPLLGSVLRLNSILRNIIKRTSKSFRRKPFTTVVKSMISADFIDRFVISPTLDDAKRFQDACDYTLRVLQTARDRNEHRFALRSKIKTLMSETTSSRQYSNGSSWTAEVQYRHQTYTESQAFMLLEARYDMTAVSPLKVWARRVGLSRPLDSVWDLVPFSFVADYFFRSGDFISHLSDKMSEVEGLKAKIANVYDVWGTLKNVSEVRSTGMRLLSYHPINEDSRYLVSPGCVYAGAWRRSLHFERFRVTDDPFSLLSSLSRDENWGALNLSLRATQKRTLAELFIQAKLKP